MNTQPMLNARRGVHAILWHLALAGLVVLAGCAASRSAESESSQPSASVSESPQPTDDSPPAGTGTDVVTGTLGADSVEGGCTYLAAADGTRYQVHYPEGWFIQASPLRLTNPDGEVVAGGGETITVRGRHAGDMVSFCQIGPIFQADEVVSIED